MSFLNSWRSGGYFLFVVLGLIIISRITAVVDGRDPGFDQAMLMSNFPLDSFGDYFRPLPLFEQATSLGSVALLDLVSNVFGVDGLDRIHAIRIWAASAACLGYYILCIILRQSLSIHATALALILIAAPNETLLFTSNPKNYVNAFLASCLLMWAGQAYLKNPDSRRIAGFLGAVIFTCFFAFTAPLIVATTGGGMLVATLSRYPLSEWRGQQALRALFRLILLGMVAVLLCLLFYIYFTKPVTILDQTAYAERYATAFLNISNPFSEQNLLTIQNILYVFYLMVSPAYFNELIFWLGLISYYSIIHVIFMFVGLIGFPTFWKRSRFLAGGLAAGVLTILAANTAHILPIASTRHFMFLTPFAVPCFALGVVTIIEFVLVRLKMQRLVAPLVMVITLGIGTAAIIRASDLENTEVSEHFAQIDAFSAPLWVYYGAQPSVRALRPDLIISPDNRTIGILPHESTTASWMLAARDKQNRMTSEDYFEKTAAALAGQEPVWLLLAHYWPEKKTSQGLDRFFSLAEAEGRVCRKSRAPGSVLALCTLPDDFPAKFAEIFE